MPRVSTSYIYIYIDSTSDVSFDPLSKRNIPPDVVDDGLIAFLPMESFHRLPSISEKLSEICLTEWRRKLIGNEIIGR